VSAAPSPAVSSQLQQQQLEPIATYIGVIHLAASRNALLSAARRFANLLKISSLCESALHQNLCRARPTIQKHRLDNSVTQHCDTSICMTAADYNYKPVDLDCLRSKRQRTSHVNVHSWSFYYVAARKIFNQQLNNFQTVSIFLQLSEIFLHIFSRSYVRKKD